MNRADRRAGARAAKKTIERRPLAEAICEVRGHAYPPEWTLRPSLVGPGIRIPKVHYDRACRRCGHTDRIWADVVGGDDPLAEALGVVEWLTRQGATVAAPEGTVISLHGPVPEQLLVRQKTT